MAGRRTDDAFVFWRVNVLFGFAELNDFCSTEK